MEGSVDAKTDRQSDYNSDNQSSFIHSAFLDRQQDDKAVVERLANHRENGLSWPSYAPPPP